MATLRSLADDLNRSNRNLVGDAMSVGQRLWLQGPTGTPTIVANEGAGAPGGVVVDLGGPDQPCQCMLKAGGRLIFRWVDVSNYWFVQCSTWSGNNADTPPVYSEGQAWTTSKVVAGVTTQVGTFNTNGEYATWAGNPSGGYVHGASNPYRLVSVTLAGSAIAVTANGGNVAVATNANVTGNYTDAALSTTGRKAGAVGPFDDWAATERLTRAGGVLL